MATLLGVDVGGTFTDLVWCDDVTGEVVVGKEPTWPDAPERGVVGAVEAALSPERVAPSSLFLHGTTVGLNALLERRGATRRPDRDPRLPRRARGAPRRPRRPLRPVLERRRRRSSRAACARPSPSACSPTVRSTVPIDLSSLPETLATFAEGGVDAVAVALLNAYANGAHELAVERELRRLGFDGEISLSHRISGEYREYERTCTTVIDAFVRRRMGQYLERLAGRARRRAGSPARR